MTREEPDIDEVERRVAQALVDMVDDAREPQRITIKSLAQRGDVSIRQVREIVREWQLQTITGDELFLAPGSVDHARERAATLKRG